MSNPMPTRRQMLLKILSFASTGALGIPVLGCRPISEHKDLILDNHGLENTVTLRSLQMYGYSFYSPGSRLGRNGVLPASVIKENKKITLDYVQDNHGHKFDLGPEQFAKLRRGQPVRTVVTTEALNHRHYVWINPRDQLTNSPAITMSVEPGEDKDHGILVFVTDEDPQQLFLAIPKSMAENQKIAYCRAALEECRNQNLWQTLENAKVWQDKKQLFRITSGDNPLGQQRQYLHVGSLSDDNASEILRSMELIPI